MRIVGCARCGYAMPPIDNRMFCHDCERYIQHSKHTAKLNPVLDEIDKLKAENAKLREALKRICHSEQQLTGNPNLRVHPDDHRSFSQWHFENCQVIHDIAQDARNALKEDW